MAVNESAENYLETILVLSKTHPVVRSVDIAEEFAGKNGYVYEIETSRGINVNEVLGADSPHPEQLEISVVDGILGSEVKGAWKVKHGKITGEYIANPNFRGRK